MSMIVFQGMSEIKQTNKSPKPETMFYYTMIILFTNKKFPINYFDD